MEKVLKYLKGLFWFYKIIQIGLNQFELLFLKLFVFLKTENRKGDKSKKIYRRGQPAELAHPWPNIVPVAAQNQPTAAYRFV